MRFDAAADCDVVDCWAADSWRAGTGVEANALLHVFSANLAKLRPVTTVDARVRDGSILSRSKLHRLRGRAAASGHCSTRKNSLESQVVACQPLQAGD